MKRRKTITFDKDVYMALLRYRGQYILKKGKDKNITEAVNELLRKQLLKG